MTPQPFGTRPDGQEATRATIRGHGLTVSVLSHGASLQDLRLDGVEQPLVLGFDSLAPYLDEGRYFGAVVGRCANRIAGGSAEIGGRAWALDRNERDRTTLHGGRDGSGQRNWTFTDIAPDRLALSDLLPDGHMGFPGALRVQVIYRLLPGPALQIEITATTSASTLCNFAQHSYFNLDGRPDIAEHWLSVPAATCLPVDAELIPLGPPAPVEGTHLDFRQPVRLGTRLAGPLIDHNLCLAPRRHAHPQPAATLRAGGLRLDIFSTEPGLQVYAGAHLRPGTPGLAGRPYGPHAGIALESQIWPDAIHHPDYPSALLHPGQTYRQITRLSLRHSPAD